MSRLTKRVVLLSVCITFIYASAPLILLRFALDRVLFPKVDSGATHEDRVLNVRVAPERYVRVRQYGASQQCVIFFPGQHGGISAYERNLIPAIEQLGMTLYTLSYPGQDGAQGRSQRATLLQDVAVAITDISRETLCQPNDAVFVGRSLGATVALYTAQGIRPKGILLDGAGPTLTTAIQAGVRRYLVTRPWSLLPLHSFVGNDFPLVPVIRSLRDVPIVIFEGEDDQVAPFTDAQKALGGLENVQFLPVPGARHDNTYQVAEPLYSAKLMELAKRGAYF
jgi:pimeloyl-ACP methyl ester carboxylesterase